MLVVTFPRSSHQPRQERPRRGRGRIQRKRHSDAKAKARFERTPFIAYDPKTGSKHIFAPGEAEVAISEALFASGSRYIDPLLSEKHRSAKALLMATESFSSCRGKPEIFSGPECLALYKECVNFN